MFRAQQEAVWLSGRGREVTVRPWLPLRMREGEQLTYFSGIAVPPCWELAAG